MPNVPHPSTPDFIGPADGGYNHFELKRHRRAYTLPGVFETGDLAPTSQVNLPWFNDAWF